METSAENKILLDSQPLTYRGRPILDDEALLCVGRKGHVTLVDAARLRVLALSRWSTRPNGYVTHSRTREALGALLLGEAPFPGAVADHKDGDKLNNKRDNLRWATMRQNNGNCRKSRRRRMSGYKGVTRIKSRWGVTIRGKRCDVYATEQEAAREYDRMARHAWGPYGCLNFPGPGERSALTGEIIPLPKGAPDGRNVTESG